MTCVPSDDCPWCREIVSLSYHILDEDLKRTMRAILINPSQKKKYRQAALKSMILQRAGPNKWMVTLQRSVDFLSSVKWKSDCYFLLSGLVPKFHQSHMEMT